MIEVGEIYDSNNYGKVIVLKYKNATKVFVSFLDTNNKYFFTAQAIKLGTIKDKIFEKSKMIKKNDIFKSRNYGNAKVIGIVNNKKAFIEFLDTGNISCVYIFNLKLGNVTDKISNKYKIKVINIKKFLNINNENNNEKNWNYTYKIINKLNNMIYYGCHSTNNLNDGYCGSNRKLIKDIKNSCISNFNLEILKNFSTSTEKFNEEECLITIDIANNKNCYNTSTGGIFGKNKMSKQSIETMKKSRSWYTPSAETKEKISKSGKVAQNKPERLEQLRLQMTGAGNHNYNETKFTKLSVLNCALSKSKGIMVTPFFNDFNSIDLSVKTGITATTLIRLCKINNNKKFKNTPSSIKHIFENKKLVGKTPKELGFDFINFNNVSIKEKINICKKEITGFIIPKK